MLWIIIPLLLFAAFAMYVRRKADRLRAEAAGGNVVVSIKLAGEGMATREELKLRNQVEDDIVHRGIGRIADSDSGEGFMRLVVAVSDAQAAPAEIRDVLEKAGVLERSEVTAGP